MAIILKNDNQKIETILECQNLISKLKNVLNSNSAKDKKITESVGEHIYGSCMLAIFIWSETLPEVNLNQVLMMTFLYHTQKAIKDVNKSFNIFNKLVTKELFDSMIEEYTNNSTPEAIFANKCSELEYCIQNQELLNGENSSKKDDDIFEKIKSYLKNKKETKGKK